MMTFERYMRHMGHSNSTIRSYLFANRIFLADNQSPENYTYKDVVEYLNGKLRGYNNRNTLVYLLNGMKKYFDYLVATGLRDDHPCKTFQIRNLRKREVIHQDLFCSEELEKLMDREERYKDLRLRNQVLVSLLIYQGLNSSEIETLDVSHIDLDGGTVFLKGSRNLGKRHLELDKCQYGLFDCYKNQARKNLLRDDSKAFLLNKLGQRVTSDGIHYLISTYKLLFPGRALTPSSIRQSVIANWLNEKKLPLLQAQHLAGHKWVSTTLKYRQENMEGQRELMNRWFPI